MPHLAPRPNAVKFPKQLIKTNCWHYPRQLYAISFTKRPINHHHYEHFETAGHLRMAWRWSVVNKFPKKSDDNVQNKNSAAILDNFSFHTPSLARLAIVSGWVISAGNLKVHTGGSGRIDQMGPARLNARGLKQQKMIFLDHLNRNFGFGVQFVLNVTLCAKVLE
jgi:hypothetical protein